MSRRAGAAPPGAPTPKKDAPKGRPATPAGVAAARLFPTVAELVDPRQPWLVPLLLMLALRVALGVYVPYASEDAYITFRYARHLASGHGLVFNPGEHVFGFSSPLWTVWTSLGYLVTHDPVLWTRLTTLLTDGLALVLVATMLRRHVSLAAAWCFAFFFAAWPYFTAVGLSGMENSAMFALVVVGAVLVERRSPFAGLALAGVALIRPEGLAAAFVLALRATWRDRLVGAVLVAAALFGLRAYFGSFVPQSVLAKSAMYGTPGPWNGRFWWDWTIPVMLGQIPRMTEGLHVFFMSVLFAPAVVFGARELWRVRRTALAMVAAACVAVWLGYVALGVAYFWWYLVVPLLGLVVLAAAGLPRLVRSRAVYVSLAAFVLGLWSIGVHLYVGRAQNEYYGFASAASFLMRYGRAGEKVMLEPIGMIGWSTPMVVVDEIGLVSPEVAKRRLQGPGWYTDVANQQRPDWLVVRKGMMQGGQAFAGAGAPFRNTIERDSLLARYQLATIVDTTSGDQSLLVLRRTR